MRTDRLRAAYQIEFRYTLFPLHPDTPDEGLSLEQLFAGRSYDIDGMNLGVTAVPTFVVGNRAVVGAQPYEVLETLVVEGGAVKR